MKFDVQKYFENSTIHGLFYISKRFNYAERIFWIFAMILSVICTSILITQLIFKAQHVLIVSHLSDQMIQVSEINFPAVTVCPRFKPSISYLKKRYLGGIKFYGYEKHTFKKYFYEDIEFLENYKEEFKLLKSGYIQTLRKLKNGIIKPEELGLNL